MSIFNRITHAKLRPLRASDIYSNYEQLVRDARSQFRKKAKQYGIRLHKISEVGEHIKDLKGSKFDKGIIVLKGHFIQRGRRRWLYAGFKVEQGRVSPLDVVYNERKEPYGFTREGIRSLLGLRKASTKGEPLTFMKNEKALLLRDFDEVDEKQEEVTLEEDTAGKEIVVVRNADGKREWVPLSSLRKLVGRTAVKEESAVEEAEPEELPLRVRRVKKFPESSQFPLETKSPEELKKYVDMIDELIDLHESLKQEAQKVLEQYREKQRAVSDEIVELSKKILADSKVLDNTIYDIGDKLLLIQRAWVGTRIKSRPNMEKVYSMALAELDDELRNKVLKRVSELKQALTVEQGLIGPKIEYRYKEKSTKPSVEITEQSKKEGQYMDGSLLRRYNEYKEGLEDIQSVLDRLLEELKSQEVPEVPLGKFSWAKPSTHGYLKFRRTYARKKDTIKRSILKEWSKGNISDTRVLELFK